MEQERSEMENESQNFDKASQTFYRSEIYGIVNFGGDRYIAGKCEVVKADIYPDRLS